MATLSTIGYLGPSDDHAHNLELLAGSHGVRLIYLPDSVSWASARGARASRAKRALVQLSGTRDALYLQNTTGLIDREGIRSIVAFWGTLPLPDLVSLKRARPHVRLVLNLLCHPLGTTRSRILLQDHLLGRAMRHIDGMIVSSEAMGQYIRSRISRTIPILKLPPYWHSSHFATAPLVAVRDRPNIVFLGRMDWASAQPTDMVERFLLELMELGIEVYYGRSAQSSVAHRNARPFEPMPIAEVANFAAQFDAALVTYNVERAPHSARFNVTVPDRLLTSVAASIPIAIPSSGFSGCMEYLKDYGAVLPYSSAEDLAFQLRDRVHIEDLRRRARASASEYHGERHFSAMLDFLSNVTTPSSWA
jgi:hypothetical protein